MKTTDILSKTSVKNKKTIKEHSEIAVVEPKRELDHEVQMAKSELYRSVKSAAALHDMLKRIPESQGLEGWVQAKITKAADYLESVYHYMDYELNIQQESELDEQNVGIATTSPAGTATTSTPGMVKMSKVGPDGKPIGTPLMVPSMQIQNKQKQGFKVIGENASAGATGAGSVASSMGAGNGFAKGGPGTTYRKKKNKFNETLLGTEPKASERYAAQLGAMKKPTKMQKPGVLNQPHWAHGRLVGEDKEDYNSLNDKYPAGTTEIWYARPQARRELSDGYEFAKKQGFTVDPSNLSKTHVLLGKMNQTSLKNIFAMMQGEVWSPKGEAKKLIDSLGLYHTSMSVGDIIKIGNKVMMIDPKGFLDIVTNKNTSESVAEAEVWDKTNPKTKHKKLTPAQKAAAKRRAKSAGRPYPNMVDNIWAAKQK